MMNHICNADFRGYVYQSSMLDDAAEVSKVDFVVLLIGTLFTFASLSITPDIISDMLGDIEIKDDEWAPPLATNIAKQWIDAYMNSYTFHENGTMTYTLNKGSSWETHGENSTHYWSITNDNLVEISNLAWTSTFKIGINGDMLYALHQRSAWIVDSESHSFVDKQTECSLLFSPKESGQTWHFIHGQKSSTTMDLQEIMDSSCTALVTPISKYGHRLTFAPSFYVNNGVYTANDLDSGTTDADDDPLLRLRWSYLDDDAEILFSQMDIFLIVSGTIHYCAVPNQYGDGNSHPDYGCEISTDGYSEYWDGNDFLTIHERMRNIADASGATSVDIRIKYYWDRLDGPSSVTIG